MKSILSFDPAALSKQKQRLKRKFYLLFVLPVILVILAVKVLQVYVSMALRKAGTQVPNEDLRDPDLSGTVKNCNDTPTLTVFGAARPKETVIPTPVKRTIIKPQFITPEPISRPYQKQNAIKS